VMRRRERRNVRNSAQLPGNGIVQAFVLYRRRVFAKA
jgi:hypothetical protein